MTEVMSYVDKDTLLILDLDNTVIEPPQMLGSDQWSVYMLKKFIAEGMDRTEADKKMIALWMRIQEASLLQPVESNIPKLICEAQNKGINVKAFNPAVADVEYEYFGKILTDKAAKAIV